jgi:hypothetical protein
LPSISLGTLTPKYFNTVGAISMMRGASVVIGRFVTRIPDVIA